MNTAADAPESKDVVVEMRERFGDGIMGRQPTRDGIPTVWVANDRIKDVLTYLKRDAASPYRMLYDLTAIDERLRQMRQDQPDCTFTLVYHLLSHERNSDVRIKVPLTGDSPQAPSITGIWQSANWYEREAFDMFGIRFDGHPDLKRILMPLTWTGHPLRKDHPARATDMGPFSLPDDKAEREEDALRFSPDGAKDVMFLNMGPHHPGTHGLLRIVLELDGEQIVNATPEIGFHHRGAEKMGERQSWHTYIPYTDRVDYLAGPLNNFPYVLAVETLAGIDVPDRAKVIRIMVAELFRISNHLVYYGTFSQ
ncbi:NADH-quinone oxidoreductase subunit C/D, partial [bacterium]|nr:NADH-quinone oxidoreductase subunit C/D [bacterium]